MEPPFSVWLRWLADSKEIQPVKSTATTTPQHLLLGTGVSGVTPTNGMVTQKLSVCD